MKENIGDRIKRLRKSKKIPAKKIAKAINKSRTTIYRYESGEIEKIPYTILKPIAELLDVTPAYLINGDDEKPNDLMFDYQNNTTKENHINEIVQICQIVQSFRGERIANFIGELLELNLKDEILDEILSFSKYLTEMENKNP